MRRSITSRRKTALAEGDGVAELLRMRFGEALRVGVQAGTWVGRLDSKSKLRISWRVVFGGPRGKMHEIACTVSRKSKKREVFFDSELIHSGALGLLESVGGVAADTTLFEHQWRVAGRTVKVRERVFVRETSVSVLPPTHGDSDAATTAAVRESARFELSIDGQLFCSLTDVEMLSDPEKRAKEEQLVAALSLPHSVDRHNYSSNNSQGNLDDLELPRHVHEHRPEALPAEQHVLHIQDEPDGTPDEQACGGTLHATDCAADVAPTPAISKAARLPYQQESSVGEVGKELCTDTGVLSDDVIAEAMTRLRRTSVCAMNGLVARLECTLGPGVLGGKTTLRNDDTGLRVEVEAATSEARACGLEHHDILLSLNGRTLPPKLDAVELMSLLRANPRYMLSEVVACVWRPLLVADSAGIYVFERLTTPLNFEIACIDDRNDDMASARMLLGYYVVLSAPLGKTTMQNGDIVVGIDSQPCPRFANAVSMAQMLGDWVVQNTLSITLWRPTNRRLIHIISRSVTLQRSLLIAAPAEVKAISSNSNAQVRGSAATAVTVTGDGGRGETDLPASEERESGMHFNASAVPTHISHVARGRGRCAGSCDFLAQTATHRAHNEIESLASCNEETQRLPAKLEVGSARCSRQRQCRGQKTAMTDRTVPLAVAGAPSIVDGKNLAVFKRLLQSGATKDVIVAEMLSAGVPQDVTQQLIESLMMLVAEKRAQNQTIANSFESRPDEKLAPVTDPRAAVMATITKRPQGAIDSTALLIETGSASNSTEAQEFGTVLVRYRKMVKLGVPVASVLHRMRLDQVDRCAVHAFAAEHGMQDHTAFAGPGQGKKRAKLHWDAMTLDDKALAVSVWAADAFGDYGALCQEREVLRDDDLEHLANLFSDAESSTKRSSMKTSDDCSVVDTLHFNGRPLLNGRLFDPQRSQNVSIAIAPLLRAFDGSIDALVCMIARMEPSLPLEQLETLHAAMPTNDEKALIVSHTNHVTHASLFELQLLDSAIERDTRFAACADRKAMGAVALQNEVASLQASRQLQEAEMGDGNFVDQVLSDVVVEHETTRVDTLAVNSEQARERVRRAFIVDKLAPAERFAAAVSLVEDQLFKLRERKSSSHAKSKACLRTRLEALVVALSARPATESLAGQADAYARTARLLMSSKELAKLLKHVLAAGNAVNAGSAKGGASAVRLPSLLQAARTKGVDGKTTLLDGVVGLLLDRVQPRSSPDAVSTPSSVSAIHDDIPCTADNAHRISDLTHTSQVSTALSTSPASHAHSLNDHLLDFPERERLLESLESVRNADERAIMAEASKFSRQLEVASKEIQLALLEFGPDNVDQDDRRTVPTSVGSVVTKLPVIIGKQLLPNGSSKAQRHVEQERLVRLHIDAALQSEALTRDHIEPLKSSADELRTYFACERAEPLDAIFATLREFLRAFCDSRDAQRRQRHAEKREADRLASKTSAKTQQKPVILMQSNCADRTTPSGLQSLPFRHGPKPLRALREATPPPIPPPANPVRVDAVLAKVSRRHAAPDGGGDSESASRQGGL